MTMEMYTPSVASRPTFTPLEAALAPVLAAVPVPVVAAVVSHQGEDEEYSDKRPSFSSWALIAKLMVASSSSSSLVVWVLLLTDVAVVVVATGAGEAGRCQV